MTTKQQRKQQKQHIAPREVRLGDLFEVETDDCGDVSANCFYEITDAHPQTIFGHTVYRANLMYLQVGGGVERFLSDTLVFEDMLGSRIEEAQRVS